MIRILVNGEEIAAASLSLEALFLELSLPSALLLVEHNGIALHRSEWSSVRLAEGDRLELLSVAAGG